MSKTFSADNFFFPGQDPGIACLEPLPPPIVAGSGARVRQIAASDAESLNRKMRRRMEDRWRWPESSPIFETHSAVVLGQNVTFGQRKVQVGGRIILSAAAGDRVWKSVLNKVSDDEEAGLVAEFQLRRARPFAPIEVIADADDTPFAIDMRNGFNFYHFITEALPQLALIAQIGSRAPIFMHMPVLSHMKDFVSAYVQALFPNTAARVIFTDDRCNYDRVRFVLNFRHYLYQSNDPRVEAAIATLGPDDPWKSLGSDRDTRKFLLKSTYDAGMKALRRHALKMVGDKEGENSTRPRRIWLGRDLSHGEFKMRPNEGENVLLEDLKLRGFKPVYLERLSPLEQIATIHSADQIVGPHGAAFAHMMFARRKASVIEIATPQVQLHRWGDFIGNAHVSGCRYSTVFADVQGANDQIEVPSIVDGHRGIHIGEAARHTILRLVDAIVDPAADLVNDAALSHTGSGVCQIERTSR